MEFERPTVKAAFPIGDSGLVPVPKEHNISELVRQEALYLYNPFETGLAIKREYMSAINFGKLANSFIVDGPDMIEIAPRSREAQRMQRNLHLAANTTWPVSVNIFIRQVQTPKRDMDMRPEITPDMGLVVSPPNRKIEGPKLTRRPGKPKPGGR
ncbi:MAG: hypothetical protein CL840_03950 [Crocinitomicaceae bacterium]|nr:hypothetical protein [Crocinitomicaceae bacterium]|tara:strand:- start:178 stop:642 length:465 start_codon:yes stop_codon:yes gene_type:complete